MSSCRPSHSRQEVEPGGRFAANRSAVFLMLQQEPREILRRLRASLTGRPKGTVYQLLEHRRPCGPGTVHLGGLPLLGGWTAGKQQ